MADTMVRDDERERFMRIAIEEAVRSIEQRGGGPFAALVVKDGQVIGTGWNAVTGLNDPTAHAEMQAIRSACAALGDFRLTGCDIYTSCEPCPMCLGAVYWSGARAVYYAATREDAAAAGFADELIYGELARPPGERRLAFIRLLPADCRRPFEAWLRKPDRVAY